MKDMAVWSINIVPSENPGDPAQFSCPLQPNAPPNTIYAETDDAVTWSNQTGETQQIQIPPGANPTFVTEEIPPDHSSRPTYLCAAPQSGTDILYCCTLHPHEQGIITLTNVTDITRAEQNGRARAEVLRAGKSQRQRPR
jgi:hypothetical protein